jgi:hypothetical protein
LATDGRGYPHVFPEVNRKHPLLYVAGFQFRYNNRFNADIFRYGDRRMIRLWRHWKCVAAALALVVYVVAFWVWQSYDFPVGYETCTKATTDHTNDSCIPQNIYLASLRKIGEIASDPHFYNALITLFAAIATAIATVYIAKFTIKLSDVGHQQAQDARIIQRAYVTISHNRPGIDVKGNSGILYFDFTIENFGQTPANISDILIKPVVVTGGTSLPTIPDYSAKRTVFRKAFLVSKDKFAIFEVLQITQQEIAGVKDHAYDLYIIGYVDYLDKFGDRHRAGYARKYAPVQDMRPGDMSDEVYATRNNLFFVPREGYNYDRLRARGEGIDWD